MKKIGPSVFLLFFWANLYGQTEFMPLGSVVTSEYTAYRYYGTCIFNPIKDTLCNGAPCRQIRFARTDKLNSSNSYTGNMYFQQKGDSIFEYDMYMKRFLFRFKNKYNLKDSFQFKEKIVDTVFFTTATVYIDSIIAQNGVVRYACRIKCHPRRSSDTAVVGRFNIYDKFIPDWNMELTLFCQSLFYDGFYYKPLCYTDNTIASYKTPNYTGSCDTIARPKIPEITTGINNEFQIFPNPANAYITIKGNNPKLKVAVRIQNLNGVTVLQKTVSLTSNVDVSRLIDGIYILTAVSDLEGW
jgi:hypothetical protein